MGSDRKRWAEIKSGGECHKAVRSDRKRWGVIGSNGQLITFCLGAGDASITGTHSGKSSPKFVRISLSSFYFRHLYLIDALRL